MRSFAKSRLPPIDTSSLSFSPLCGPAEGKLSTTRRTPKLSVASSLSWRASALDELAIGARREVLLAVRFAARGPTARKLGVRIHADFVRASFGRELLPHAEARLLLARVGLEIQTLGHPLDLGEIRAGCAACGIRGIRLRHLGAQLERAVRAVAQVGARESRVAGGRAFLDERGAELELVVGEPRRCARARRRAAVVAGQGFVLGDHVDRVERRVAARHGPRERHDACQIVDAVVDEPRELLRLDDDLAADPIAHFDAQPVAVRDEIGARELVGARRAVAEELVAAVSLAVVRRERADLHALTGEVGLETGQAAAVAAELREREAGLKSPNIALSARRSIFK